jgi:HAD superfamily hydrolase (TIGR01662 family)
MLVYRDHTRTADTIRELTALRRALREAGGTPSHDTITSLLVDLGIVESAVADALCPETDTLAPPLLPLRRAAVALGHALAASWRGNSSEAAPWVQRAQTEVELLATLPLPDTIPSTVPEGFAYYAVHPECYLAAAGRFAAGRPLGRAVCVGLRSIGAPLSGVVAAALERLGWTVTALTVRPRGHPFERSLSLGPDVSRQITACDWCLIVDEGPGLSGSSFAGAAATAMRLGVPRDRIGLFPSWDTDGSTFRSAEARRMWGSLARYTVDPAALNLAAWLAAAAGGGVVEDLSAGRWRSRAFPRGWWPAVQPQHERRKYLVHGTPPTLLRFAGLGRFGADRSLRAEWLAAAGVAPAPRGFALGYLGTEWLMPARRPMRSGLPEPPPLDRVARYLALLASQPTVEPGLSAEELIGSVAANTREALGDRWADLAEGELRAIGTLEAPAVAHDGRMLAYEWVTGPGGPLKTDALDHHDDHFLPGPTNIAWDLAGTVVEFGLGEAAAAELARRYRAYSGDRDAAGRLPAFKTAYLAVRLGYVTLAGQSLGGTPDGRRFDRLIRRYRRALRAAIAQLRRPGRWRSRLGMTPTYALVIFDADDTLRRTIVAGLPCPYTDADWELLPGVRETIAGVLAQHPEVRFGIASNQDRVGYGRLEEATARALLHSLARAAFGRDLPRDAVQLCPHAVETPCRCRKPAPGMLHRIMEHYRIPAARTLFVGNTEDDRAAAAAAGTAFAQAEDYFSSSAASSLRRIPQMRRPSGVGSCDGA